MKNIDPTKRAEEMVIAMMDTSCPVKRATYMVDMIIEDLYYDSNANASKFNYWQIVREEITKIDLESQEIL